MIRHIVLIQFQSSVDEGEILDIWSELAQIKGKIPGLLEIKAGKSQSPEMLERGYMHGFTVDFASWRALHAYQEHPEHKKLGARLIDKALGGLDGILVFDLPF